ncbi:MAG: hypothetical protein U9O20_01260 [Patescibacteria group bacterium]|nr:hypothetical protein [Patescibacteria group bacterium]
MKTKKIYKFVRLVFLSAISVMAPMVVFAGSYVTREPIPGAPRRNNFIEYLGDLYGFGIAVAAILAIFMISFGAFVYIVSSAGNSAKMGNAKDMIFNAIYGLIIALIAYLILFVVNPDLVRGTIDSVPPARDFMTNRGP